MFMLHFGSSYSHSGLGSQQRVRERIVEELLLYLKTSYMILWGKRNSTLKAKGRGRSLSLGTIWEFDALCG